MVLPACLSLVLARHSQQRRLVIGTDYAGRDLPQTQELIGLFVNQLAIVAAVDGAQSFSDFLRSVRANTLFAYQHQHVPVDRIVARLGLPRRPTQHPLFQTKLVLQNFRSTDAAAFQALKVGHVPLATQHSKIDLMLTLTESAGAMPAQWEYNSTYLHAGTIAQLQDEFLELLQLLRSVDHAMPLAELERRLDYKQAERIAELRARARPALRGGRRTTLNLA
jgi:non-ribosomal peptide synthetase component F